MKNTTLPPDYEASGAPSRRPASVCAEAAPILPFEAPGERPTVRTRYRLRLEVEATLPDEPAAPIRKTEDVLRFLWRNVFAGEPREVLAVVFVDTRNRPIGHQLAYTGSLSRCVADPRHILASALLCNAAGLLLAHNHPSGDVEPSGEDLLATSRLEHAGEIVGVRLLDSLILGYDRDGFCCYSMLKHQTVRIPVQPLTPGAHPAPPL